MSFEWIVGVIIYLTTQYYFTTTLLQSGQEQYAILFLRYC